MARIVQISDTHLSRAKKHFVQNWPPLLNWLEAQKPDLIIHTGDVTVDGATEEDDTRYCAELLRTLPAPLLVVPGNHDVGEAKHAHHPVNTERLDRWRRHFGDDWWQTDIEDWRLIGLNSMLFSSGIEDERRQRAWLERTLADSGDRKVAWFTHMPLFVEDPLEDDIEYLTVKPEPRAYLMDLIHRHQVAVVATGHLHKSHVAINDGCQFIWGPSSSFMVGPANQPPLPGERLLGAVMYTFTGHEVDIALSNVPDLTPLWIDDVMHEVYPAH